MKTTPPRSFWSPLLFTVLGLGLAACEDAKSTLAQREVALSERAAVARYGTAAASAGPAQEAWVQAARETQRLTDPAAIGRQYREQVLPKLATFRDALGAMPADTDALREAHGALSEAYGELSRGMAALAEGLDSATYTAKRKAYRDVIARFEAAQATYRERIAAIYGAAGLEVLPLPPL